jgi:hypothetical protein
MFPYRDAREGWPLLTVETEVDGDSKRTNDRDPSLIGSFGLVVPVQEIFVALAPPVSPVQNIIFLTAHFFTLLIPIA